MVGDIVCPFCGNHMVQMIDHIPMTMSVIPFDPILYAEFQCLSVGCMMRFEVDLKITTFDIPMYINLN
jgi:hypothetical protein